ncbi:MAG TPA: alpha-2-macroglobulin family protein [Thermoanaerobaculia bacterium]|nr:alpha-2-macroglobulin family protein [Thermoanaerobaculia bacterium]
MPSTGTAASKPILSAQGIAALAEIDRLATEEQKVQAAYDQAVALLATARAAGDEPLATRALIKAVKMKTGLGGYETAVRFLREEEWPKGQEERAVLDLYYGAALVSYLEAYSWEIRHRERVTGTEKVDLAAWTHDQLTSEAIAAYARAWGAREALGALPVGAWAEFLNVNDYPAGVRGTLRDAVSYLFAGLLADSSIWSPAEGNGTWRLDRTALVAETPPTVRLGDPAGPAVHPLSKLVAVLGDLEAWHRRGGRKAAELEAWLARVRHLSSALDGAADQAFLTEQLAARLNDPQRGYRAVSWWSMGQAALAERVRQEDRPDAQIDARRIALAGLKAYPGSPGGAACRRIVREIEAPDFSVESMASDGPKRRSLQVRHKNLPALYFRSYRLDLAGWIEHGGDMPLLEGAEPSESLLGKTPEIAWGVKLPATPDFANHTTYVTPPLGRPGAYAILISAREDFRAEGNRLLAVRLELGDLVLANRGMENGKMAVLALDGNSGRALPGTEVRLYREGESADESVLVATSTAGADGFVRFDPETGTEYQQYFLVGRKGESAAYSDLGWLYVETPEVATSHGLIFTDRAVYRPGQKVLWKVLAYRGKSDEVPQLLPAAEVKITLLDPLGAEAGSAIVTTNAYGTASGELVVPTGRTLGAWSLSASFGTEAGGVASIQVEEYKRPTFEVTLDPPAETLRLNRPAKLAGTARYLFGLPVTGGEGVQATWQVTREPVYPDWWAYWGWRPQASESERVAAGEAKIGADGTFTVAFNPEADERAARDVSYRFRISVAVTDEGGETREAERSYRVGFVAIEATLQSDRAFLEAGHPTEPNEITIVRNDLDGAPRAGRGSWRLLALRQPDRPLLPSEQPILPPPGAAKAAGATEPIVTPGDRLRPRWEPYGGFERTLRVWDDGAEIARGELIHDAAGRASVELPALELGAYRLRYETVDDFGARAETQGEWIVVGPAGSTEGAPLPVATLLAVEKTTVRPGETAHLLVHSGFPGQELILETYQSGRLRERRRLTAEDRPIRIDVAIGPADRGGLFFRLFAVRDFQSLESAIAIEVPWDDRELAVELSSFRDRIRPGDRESWKVMVHDPAPAGSKGEPGSDDSRAPVAAAELLASMYDRSLDAFAPYDPPSVIGLFPRRAEAPSGTGSSLGVSAADYLTDDDLVTLPEGVQFQQDQLSSVGPYALGGPGWRGRAMFAMRAEAPQAVAETIMVTGEGAPVAPVEIPEIQVPAPPPPAPPKPPAAPVPLRSSFAETAFWQPHLLTGADGSAAIEFTVPDSLTSWSVWVHALTRDLRSGSVHAETRSAKSLMVRPYLPRFLREGDQAEIRAVVNNAGEVPLSGEVRLELVDGATQEDRLAAFGLAPEAAVLPFTVEPGGGATVVFPIVVPKTVGEVEFRVTARSSSPEGGLSDGELRALPILPSRLHLAQSRFAALRGKETRTLEFDDLAKSDPTRTSEQLVVTLDAQLFYSVLDALPYLIDYPYECTEQTLNRFLSTGIVRSLFDRYPAVAEMAVQMATRETATEPWGPDDPNRRMLLEETPWLAVSRGGREGDGDQDLIRVLDPKIAEAQRNASLAKLEDAQLSSGAFPWWPGGPASDYMTIYLLAGFARATEFEVEVPPDLVQKGWSYLGGRYRNEWAAEMAKKDGCCVELLTLLNYVASAYPDPSWMAGALDPADRTRIADYSFSKWREHSPYLKGLLALTLHRMGRGADAKLVFDSVMDSARTTRDEGTFWQPEERSWLWYQDTIESHAFALRTLLELAPEDPRLPGLVQWIFLQKKLGHWQSTRTTAEVLYSLAVYLEKANQLGTREAATVAVSGVPQGTTRFVFEPDRYTGKHNQIVIPGAAVDAASAASPKGGQVTIAQETSGLMFASATWHFATDQLPAQATGDLFHVERHYFRRLRGGAETTLEPLAADATLQVGDEVEVQLTISSRAPAEYVHLRDPRAAGFEPGVVRSGYAYDLGLGRYEETRDAATDFFFEYLPSGTYTLKYRLRANVAGIFRIGPATLQSLYAPEFVAYSAGAVVRVAGE